MSATMRIRRWTFDKLWAQNPATALLQFSACMAACILMLACPGVVGAQSPAMPGTVQDAPHTPPASSSTRGGLNGVSTTADSSSGDAPMAAEISSSLSSAQILAAIQQHPDAMEELKAFVADRLTQTGAAVQANDITDQMLYEQLGSSAELRAAVTTFLRARGYLSDTSQRTAGDVAGDEIGAEGGISAADSTLLTTGVSRRLHDGESTNVTETDTNDTSSLGRTSALPGRRLSTRESRGFGSDGEQPTPTSTDEPKVLRVPTPYNLRSLRDLYTQVPGGDAPLKRFGSDLFLRTRSITGRGADALSVPLDVPLGPDYILGAGDILAISLWGATTKTLTSTVDRDGRILLPEAGSLTVGGLSLARAQPLIESALQRQFRNAQVSVTVSRLRSVRIYVAGDVQRPGGYEVSPLATPLSALYAAGGPTASGSLRVVRHMRGFQLVEEVDLYDFLLHGIRTSTVHLESGDTLLVPTVGPQIAVSGAVRRPAVYEMRSGENLLATLLDDAGGLTAAASPAHITVDRIDANGRRVTLPFAGESSDWKQAAAKFAVSDGDRIHVAPVLAYSERLIYMEGHVARPGRIAYTDGMRLGDVLRSYQDLLPEPAAHGEIVRLVAPDLHAETINFNLPDVLIGNSSIALQPFDTIRVFGRYEVDAPRVTISGEVLRPGIFPMSNGMTAAQLVRVAGGFKRDALLDSADLTSYSVVNGNRVVSSLAAVHIGAAVNLSDTNADVMLKPGDILTIHQVSGWSDIGDSVVVEGQVAYPGSYGLREGERLSSVLGRAGGFRNTAYPEGIVLVRAEVRQLEEKSRQELIRQIETSSAAARLSPTLASGETGATLQMINQQQDQILARLKSQPASGRLVVHIGTDVASWANTDADIELRRGDVLTIPKRPGFVLVTGQVYNPTAITFAPAQTAGWYLSHAGGANSTANRKEIFVIRANGSVVGRRSGRWLGGDVLATKLNPGDVVVVPQKIVGASHLWRNLLTTAQLVSSIAITAAVTGL